MAESEIFIHKRNIKSLTEKLQKLEIENQKNEEKISQVKSENKVLYSTEYDLIHKILHYEKKLSELTNMKQKNLNTLNQSRIESERVEQKLNNLVVVRDRIINTNLKKKERMENKLSKHITYEYVFKPQAVVSGIGTELLYALKQTARNSLNNLSSILYEKNNQLSLNFEKKTECIDKLRNLIDETDIKVDELEYPEEIMNRLYSMITNINSKNNYYELVEREENIKQLSEDKQRLAEMKKSIYEKLKRNHFMKIKKW
jgi:hypothetical protein